MHKKRRYHARQPQMTPRTARTITRLCLDEISARTTDTAVLNELGQAKRWLASVDVGPPVNNQKA